MHRKRLISISSLVLMAVTNVTAQTCYTRSCQDKKLVKEARKWIISETDVLAIPKGKHPIPGSKLVASVEDSD